MGIPGEDLQGSHPATEFVAWYNGHPDYRDCQFDLSQERAAVVGVGNVAIDVARILCRSAEELAKTDIADYALEALPQEPHQGGVPARPARPGAGRVHQSRDQGARRAGRRRRAVVPEEVELDPLSRAGVEASQDRATRKKVEILREYAPRKPSGKSKKLIMRFLVSPVELIGDDAGECRRCAS